MPTTWIQLSQQLVQQTPGFTPPVAARAYGYIGVTLYEAVVAGMPEYQSLAGQLSRLRTLPKVATGTAYHWPTVANTALATIIRQLFATATPENQAAIDDLEAEFTAEFAMQVEPTIFTASVVYGQAVANAIFVWSKSDGGHEGYYRNHPKSYTPPVGEGLWTPTPKHFAHALQPTWGRNRPFVTAIGMRCAAPPPPAFSTAKESAFYQSALEVYNTVKTLTPEQKEIVLFWADDPITTATPAGHSVAIATALLQQEEASLARAALVYAHVGIAVNDAFISVWRTKFRYNLVRPITYIQQHIDQRWNNPEVTDPIATPPFPAYTSGHAGEAGAAMTVLTALFGENYAFVDRTHIGRGFAPRAYDSLMAAAEEAALSRLYGGIHYRFDNEMGLQQGVCVGKQVLRLKFQVRD
ncbi:MAG: vanadium-dependent haloperoxidase [Caldilineaceae bacterium]